MNVMWAIRRVRFPLTPLMDLLLIIVFAQFLDVRETSQQQSVALANERSKLTEQIAMERSELAGIRQAMQAEQKQLQSQRDQARADRDEAVDQSETKLADVQLAMDLIAKYFQVDQAAITQMPRLGDPTADNPVDNALARASELANGNPDAVIRFLVGHAELLKRAEIWTVHADDAKAIHIRTGNATESFRLESGSQAERTAEVAERLFAAYKQFPQPKGLVVLLVSFDPQSVAGVYQPLIDAMPQTLERLRSDTPQSRFEYTVLGATPDPMPAQQRTPAE
ncbi:hypothetical protein SAMN06265222_105193 [Neorhodopirellula lusitana]|uniref:Uncharacterized protein n=1 Tax=Neorhodopirellula lusitana TaxID=445327 RepID=A0ABY1Q522_9BACT|nr:hypothetical protein [Neorhodopirellula lusitana]SMP56695.1 hypothetical protein SAMN06265222_105193 [Neorhodopirellula lusitana]